jgi:hypothetical protein
MKPCMGVEAYIHSFLTWEIHADECSGRARNSPPPEKSPPVPIVGCVGSRTVWAFWRRENSVALVGIRSTASRLNNIRWSIQIVTLFTAQFFTFCPLDVQPLVPKRVLILVCPWLEGPSWKSAFFDRCHPVVLDQYRGKLNGDMFRLYNCRNMSPFSLPVIYLH